VATRADLNAAEQDNIVTALARPRWRRGTDLTSLLDDQVIRDLHRDLFGRVWRWAGAYRTRELNIGVDPRDIAVGVRDLTQDAVLWFAGSRPMAPDEAGYRFHHRLVQIHPFPNGNGRLGRAMTDLVMMAIGSDPFTWGRNSLNAAGSTRDAYLAALRAADANDFGPIARFVRS
jgi:Fic-DOC domain mobile mystery protein B